MPDHGRSNASAHTTHRVGSEAGPAELNDPRLRQEAKRAFIWIALIAAVALVVFLSQSLLVIFGAVVFATLVDGGARLLGRVMPIARGWRVAIVLVATTLFLVWLAYSAGSQITAQAAALPATIQAQAYRLLAWANRHGFQINPRDIQGLMQQAIGGIGQVTHVVGGIIGAITTLFLIVVIGVYLAVEPAPYQRGVAWLLPRDQRAYFQGTATKMGQQLRRLLAGRLMGMGIEGIATWLLLQIYGVPMAALLGTITALLAFLPNIGAPISGTIMVLVGFSGGTHMGIFTLIVYAVVQTVDGYIIVPIIARKAVDLPPALVLAAQLIMGVLFGILGLALADPMVAMTKVWLERRAERNERDTADPRPMTTA